MQEKGWTEIFESITPLKYLFCYEIIVMFMCYKRPLSPQAKNGYKIWEIVHNAGELWQNFSRIVAENYSQQN